MLVDGPGDQFLARAALAGDQHWKALVGDTADGLVHFLHGRAAADNGFAREVVVRRCLRNNGRIAHQPADLQRFTDHAFQLLHVERLEQVVVRPLLHRLDGRIGRAGQGDKDDWDTGIDLANLTQDLQSGLVRQAQVEENNVRRRGRDVLQTLRTSVSDLDSVCGGGEYVAHLFREQPRVVIDKQQVRHGRVAVGWLLDPVGWLLDQTVGRTVDPERAHRRAPAIGATPAPSSVRSTRLAAVCRLTLD